MVFADPLVGLTVVLLTATQTKAESGLASGGRLALESVQVSESGWVSVLQTALMMGLLGWELGLEKEKILRCRRLGVLQAMKEYWA